MYVYSDETRIVSFVKHIWRESPFASLFANAIESFALLFSARSEARGSIAIIFILDYSTNIMFARAASRFASASRTRVASSTARGLSVS
jgi:hypothetical protein